VVKILEKEVAQGAKREVMTHHRISVEPLRRKLKPELHDWQISIMPAVEF
jgi:hypothetical protein